MIGKVRTVWVSWWDPVTKQNKPPTNPNNSNPKTHALNHQTKSQKASQVLTVWEFWWPSNRFPKLSPRSLFFFLELGFQYLFSCCNLFKCCSWHSHLSCNCAVIIWDLSVNFKVEVLNFYRHAQYLRFQKHSCIFSKLECSYKVFKFHVRFRFWIRVWEGNSFFLSVRFKPNFF